MRKLASLVILLFCVTTVSAQGLPRIAVYVTGDVSDNERKALGTRMLASLVNSGRYKGIERSNSFLAEIEKEQEKQRSGEIDDNQISELGKQFGVKFVCIADITPAFGDFQVSARIVNVETAEVEFIGDASGQLKSMADLTKISEQVVKNMFTEETKAEPKQETKPEPAAQEPPPAISQAKAEPPKSKPVPEPKPKPKPESKPRPPITLSAGGGVSITGGFGGGIKWESGEAVAMPYNAAGAQLFFDAVYAEAVVGLSMGGGKWTGSVTEDYLQNKAPDMQRTYVNIGAFAKYPFTAGIVKAFPLLGFEYEASVSGKLVYANGKEEIFDGGSLSAPWLKLGAGADIGLGKKLYLRAEFFYGLRTENAYEKEHAAQETNYYGYPANARGGNGITLKVGAGIKF